MIPPEAQAEIDAHEDRCRGAVSEFLAIVKEQTPLWSHESIRYVSDGYCEFHIPGFHWLVVTRVSPRQVQFQRNIDDGRRWLSFGSALAGSRRKESWLKRIFERKG